jgi:integrase
MPLKLIPPKPGKTPFYYVRGTHIGVTLDRSTKTSERATAARMLRLWKEDIERGATARPGEPTFFDAAVKYMAQATDTRFVDPLVDHFGQKPLREITQQAIDEASLRLYPKATPATRNRQCHTVVSAILKHAGVEAKLKRPKGWRGSKRTDWLKQDEAFALLDAADKIDAEFGIFLTALLYTGMRLGEALKLTTDRLELSEGFAYLPKTKNSEPRAVFLPPAVVAALASHPRGLKREGRVFRFVKCGRLYELLKRARTASGGNIDFVTFHTFRHTWATWMRRYGGLDTRGLVGTGAWSDQVSAARYEHVVVTEESRKAILLPVRKKA